MALLSVKPPHELDAAEVVETTPGPIPKPPQCRVEVVERDGTRMWRVPAKGGCHFLIVFGSLWLAFTSVFFFLAVFGESDVGGWGKLSLGLFMGLFVVVGIVVLFLGLRLTRTEHWLLVTDDTFAHESRFFRRAKRLNFTREGLSDVSLQVAYEENYKPVYCIQVIGREGKTRFGTALSAEEKAWLLGDLQQALKWGEENENTASETTTATASPMGDFQAGGLTVSPRRGSCTIAIAGSEGTKGLMIGGAVFAFISGVMIALGPKLEGGFPAFFAIFALLWYGGLGLFFGAGLLVLVTGLTQLGLKRKLIASPDGLRLEWQRGSKRGEFHWRNSEIDGIDISLAMVTSSQTSQRTGSTGSQKNYRVEIALPGLIGGLGQANSRGELLPVVGALKQALGRSTEI